MELIKTNEKIIIWMHRNNITGQQIANEMGITRQAWSSILKSNLFKFKHISTLKRLGFYE
jgi:predicted transcriptional regulator